MINQKYDISKSESDLKDYDYNSIYPISLSEKNKMFESDEFYNNLEFKPGVVDVLKKYADSYNFVIFSKGTQDNLKKKKQWLENNLPYNFEFIGITADNETKFNLIDSIQISDNSNYLNTNATLKILYKSFNNFPWQNSDTINEYMVVNSWNDIDSILNFYREYDCKTLERR